MLGGRTKKGDKMCQLTPHMKLVRFSELSENMQHIFEDFRDDKRNIFFGVTKHHRENNKR